MITSSAALVGCGGDELTDKEYGFIDLAPYYYDGSTAANPTLGLPRELPPQRGWLNGQRAEFYDFGLVSSVKRRTDANTPDYAVVPPMYFFYDENRNPLFSKPIWEGRTASWHMRGGREVLNPNPRPTAAKNVPYSVRARDVLGDFQRPIVDRIQHNSDYTGLWEVVEITVGSDYQPDAVKSFATLKKGIDEGAFVETRTAKVINCPIIDDRTYVTPSAMYYGIPRPQIEIWYRTKRGRCFLADGWLTLGDPNGNLLPAGSRNRVQTFDIIAYTVGTPGNERTTVVAPFGRMFVPTVRVANQDPARTATDIRYIHDNLTEGAQAKRHPNDPPGYRPLRWLWDVRVPQDPPYESGTYKTMDSMDPAAIVSRGAWTKNYPLIGVAVSCTSNEQCADLRVGPPNSPPLTCNQTPNLDIFANELPPPSPGKVGVPDAKTLSLQREGGPRCDLPVVSYGEFCAPGVARCQFDRDPMGPTVGGMTLTPNPDPADSTKTIPAQVSGSTLIGGYACQPANTGYCYFRCDVDGGGTNRKETLKVAYSGPAGQMLKTDLPIESDPKCGFLQGYRCLNPATSPGFPVHPTKNRVCLRQCSTANPDRMNDQYCGKAPYQLSVGIQGRNEGDITKGQTCSNRGLSGSAACQWDPAYEPRDPNSNYVGQ